jgi:hypothetical protein
MHWRRLNLFFDPIYDLFTKFTLLFTLETPLLKDIKVIWLDQFDIY